MQINESTRKRLMELAKLAESVNFKSPSQFKQYYILKELEEFLQRKPLVVDVLHQWTKNNNQLYDDHVHGFFPFNELYQYIEIDRSSNPRNSPEEIEELRDSLKSNGWKQDQPLIMTLNKALNKAIGGEGNHRMMICKQIGFTNQPIPVRFIFYTGQ